MLEVPHLLLYTLVTIYNSSSSWFHYSKRKTHKQQAWEVQQKRRDSLHATAVASHCLQTCLKRC